MVATVKFPERNALIVSLYEEGLTFGQIAEQIGSTRNAVAGVLNRAGIAERGGKKLTLDDLSGRKFGLLTVIERGPNSRTGMHRYYCRCDCGRRRLVQSNALRCGISKSCGCTRAEALRKYGQNDPIRRDAVKLRRLGWRYREIGQALEIEPWLASYLVKTAKALKQREPEAA